MASLNFFDTYTLLAVEEEVVPQPCFFKERYFPTGADDVFAADKVLTEYRKGDRKMAPFVAPRAGSWRGFISKYEQNTARGPAATAGFAGYGQTHCPT